GQSWPESLVFFNRVPTGMDEPVFGADSGFFLFGLPFYDRLFGLFVIGVATGTVAGLLASLLRTTESGPLPAQITGDRPDLSLLTGSAALMLVLAAGQILSACHLVFSDLGVVRGAGWTDVHVSLPARLVTASLMVALGALLLSGRFRRHASRLSARALPLPVPIWNALLTVWLAAGALWVVGWGVLPRLVQWLVVEPNEISFERPYLKRNIDFTRHGFRLDRIEERRFPAGGSFTPATAAQNRDLLADVRLWDWRALDAVYKQFQEIRLYYEFVDVDMDRYSFNGRYRQVMASARELAQDNLAPQSQTFVNRRFKYTHGYGLTLATVSDFTPEGLPNLLVRDIPPQSEYRELDVTRPQIYYGELTSDPVVVHSAEVEFDYPSGDKNRYIRYPGQGGVAIDSLWRKFLLGWKFDGTRLFLSGYPTGGSRIMFHRQIRDRVKQVAPFLTFDEDPYIVLVDGRLYWIIDAYTTSQYLPYSEPFSSREVVHYRDGARSPGFSRRTAADLNGVNYVRNSVKAVVDAFEGSVDLYVFDSDDPVIQVWQHVLPQVFKPAAAMPSGLRRHVRYPQDFLLMQGLVYAKYHMHDPDVFYNQEDLWVRATEKHYDQVQPVEPYYVMWQLPGSDRAEFVLIQPFTPKNRQVLIGWIAGLCHGDNYGRFIAYQFPKEKRILGPQQVETKIDQDSFLSGQLTLWDQRGSHVIRGNVLAIPVDDTLLYVEPIYLQAETAAYPELRLVVVMHGDTMSYAESFDAALSGLLEGAHAKSREEPLGRMTVPGLGKQLDEAFSSYLNALGKREFEAAARHLDRLIRLIETAATAQDRVPPQGSGDNGGRAGTGLGSPE
ncbi:MAG: UPF0182 family protein, partial [Gammaproteobacteria bacterium]